MTQILTECPRLNTARIVAGGVCFRIETNNDLVLETTQRGREPVESAVGTDVELIVTVTEEIEESGTRAYFRGRNHLVYMSFGGSCFLIDVMRRTAHAIVSRRTAADADLWQTILIPILLGILGPTVGVIPLHSACLMWKDKGVLLAGESGAGKSTLAVALSKFGMQLVSDDWTYLSSTGGRLLCHGVNAPVKLLADAHKHFPELARLQPKVSLNGELAYEVNASSTLGLTTSTACFPSVVVFVARHNDCTRLRKLEKEQVSCYFMRNAELLPPQLFHLERTRQDLISEVSSLPAWEYLYRGTPQQGAQQLFRTVEGVL